MTVSAGLSTMKLAACCPNLEHHTTGPLDASIDHQQEEGMHSVPSLPAAPPIHVMSSLNLDPSLSTALDPSPLHSNPSHPHRNLDCPSCHDSMSELVKQVPYSHHVNSSLVCRMSGKVMDDENYPMAFPNGYVYSHQVGRRDIEEVSGRGVCTEWLTASHYNRHYHIWRRRITTKSSPVLVPESNVRSVVCVRSLYHDSGRSGHVVSCTVAQL